MTEHTLLFSEDKTERDRALGVPPTHWTIHNMKHCTCIKGKCMNNPVQAAMEYFEGTHFCADEGPTEFIDGEELLSLNPVTVPVYGLVRKAGSFYWTGETKVMQFLTSVAEVSTANAWTIKYDNDTGPCDESYHEWWEVTNETTTFRANTEADAKWLCDLLNKENYGKSNNFK